MPYRIITSALAEAVGKTYGDFSYILVEPIREFACDLWRDYPDQITQNLDLARSFQRGYMSSICGDQVQPPVPQVPFSGGQCDILYDGNFNYDVSINGGTPIPQNASWQGVLGPITAIILFNDDICLRAVDGNPSFPLVAPGIVRIANNPNPATTVYSDPEVVSVTPSPGQPGDTCGDPPPQYEATEPTPADYCRTINYPLPDGGSIDLEVCYEPDNYNYPMVFDVEGIKVNFDLGGITIDYSRRNPDDTPPPLPDGNLHPLPRPEDDPNRLFGCDRTASPTAANFDVATKSDTDPKEEEVGEVLRFVEVNVTTIPGDARSQAGDGAPNVFYCGWFEFQSEARNFPRQPIHFAQCLFEAPDGATGYAYTLYNGFNGNAVVYTEKQED